MIGSSIGRRLAALWRQRRGNAAIELSILSPPLILLLVGAADYGAATYRQMQVQHAAQAGAEYAMKYGFASTAIATAVTSATALTGVTATPAPAQSCGCASGATITTATCGSTCAATGLAAGTYVTVSAQGSYTTIVPYPGIPSTFALSGSSTVRIK